MDWDSIYVKKKKKKSVFVGKLNVSRAYRKKVQPIEDRINYHNAMNSWDKELTLRAKEDKKALGLILSTLSNEQSEFINFEIEQSEGGTDFKIISDKPNWKPEWEKGYDRPLMQVWVDQSCGISGDDYSGYVFIEIIPDKKYLKWFYCM